ncbi:Fibrinogen alpha/beta/gamma chain C-terminal globular domain [Trinorchestia longiramus]|nr:Fibrinogen alpha/beta/gamma chain C-terminal globular domain [Trinorchestia longiramus]
MSVPLVPQETWAVYCNVVRLSNNHSPTAPTCLHVSLSYHLRYRRPAERTKGYCDSSMMIVAFEMRGDKKITSTLLLVTVLTSIHPSQQLDNCDEATLPVIENSEQPVIEEGTANYTCSAGYSFISGAAVRISTCGTEQEWMPIADLCSEGCPVPRHCGDLLQLGLTNNGLYKIVPSGNPQDPSVLVNCFQNTNGGGWTKVYRQSPSAPLASTNQESSHYTIGMENWRKLTEPTEDSEAAVVMTVALSVPNNGLLIAHYDNVTFGPGPDYKLLSIGNYHGNAGNALCSSVGVDFIMDWWTPWISKDNASTRDLIANRKGSYLKASQSFDWKLLWGSVEDIQTAEIFVRPKSIDERTTCPNMANGDVRSREWSSTTEFVHFDIFNLPGANITYKCKGEFKMEGKPFENRTFEGTAICLDETPPRWDRNLTLPCKFGCVEDYSESDDVDECYRAYNGPDSLDFLNSAYRCTAEGAHLVRLMTDYVEDMLKIEGGSHNYYTVHSAEYGFDDPLNPIWPEYPCKGSPICNITDECSLITNPTSIIETKCDEEKSSICMMPAVCPSAYQRAVGGGSCLKMISMSLNENENYGEYLEELADKQGICRETGGALAQPTSLRDLNSLIGFVRARAQGSPKNVLLGLTQMENGTWISNSYINDSILESNFTSSAWGAVVLRVEPTSHEFLNGTANVDTFLCMWPGQLECLGYPPEPTENMTQSEVSNETNADVQYKCHYGYFVNGNASVPTGQIYHCVGNSGDWLYDKTYFPELQDCFEAPVCENDAQEQLKALVQVGLQPNVPTSELGNLTVDKPEFVNGSISYACPADKTTMSGNRTQRRECVINNPQEFRWPQESSFSGAVIQSCQRCVDFPNIMVKNSTNDFREDDLYLDGSDGNQANFFNINCDSGYEMGFGVSTQKIYCTVHGWNLTGLQNCSQACLQNPGEPDADAHMVRDALLSRTEGTVLHFNCSEGYYFGPDADNLQSRANETCDTSGSWVKKPLNFELRCYHICNWKGVVIDNTKMEYESNHTLETYTNGSTIEAECNAGYEWSFNETKQTFECTNDGWNITHQKDCVRACPVEDVPQAGARMTRSDVVANTQGAKITYTCVQGYSLATTGTQGNSSDASQLELTCNSEGMWEENINVENYDCKHPCGAGDVDIANATSDFNSSLSYSHVTDLNLTLTCLPGFEWRFNDTKQSISCTETGWDTSDVQKCYRACPADAPTPGESMNRAPVTDNTVGAELMYDCQPGFYVNITRTAQSNESSTAGDDDDSDLKRLLKLTCAADGKWTNQYPDVNLECYHKCRVVMPPLINAHTDYDASTNYSHLSNETLTATCNHGYQFAFNETEQVLHCTAVGWSMLKIKPCYRVCVDSIEPPGEEMTVADLTKNEVNTTMTYTCNTGFYLNVTEDHANITDAVVVTCRQDGLWHYERQDLQCVKLCEEDPPSPIGNSSTDWNNFTRFAGATLTYSCPDGKIFGNMNSTLQITCDNGTWTSFSEDFMTCAIPCVDQNPPTNISNAIPQKQADFRELDFLIYDCPPKTATLQGENQAVLQCQPDIGWNVVSINETLEEMLARFHCSDACPGPAVEPDSNWESNWTSVFLTGTVIWYLCPNSSYLENGDEPELFNKCENNEWSFPGIPYCLDPCSDYAYKVKFYTNRAIGGNELRPQTDPTPLWFSPVNQALIVGTKFDETTNIEEAGCMCWSL